MINFSEIMWKPRRGRRFSAVAVGDTAAEPIEIASALRDVPVDEAEIGPASRIVFFTDPRSPSADRFRYLRIQLREVQAVAKLRNLLITSPLPQDGKSTIALNLAAALAENGKRPVLLVEADLHQPTLAQSLGLKTREGLAECLEDGLDPLLALRRIEPLGFYLLQAGRPRGNPTELLQSESMSGLMQSLSQHFEWILIDTPPVLLLTDAASISRLVDATLLVVRADRTTRDAVEQAVAILGPKQILGIVLNAAGRLNKLYSKYYRYGYYSKT